MIGEDYTTLDIEVIREHDNKDGTWTLLYIDDDAYVQAIRVTGDNTIIDEWTTTECGCGRCQG